MHFDYAAEWVGVMRRTRLQTDGSHTESAFCMFGFFSFFLKTFDGSQAEGRRGSRGLLSVTVGAASSGAESLTSAARPVLADLKAVSAEAEGAVPCHDAAVAAAQLVAG